MPTHTLTRAAVVVLGDVGRSPRMQYHALALAAAGVDVDMVGYEGTAPPRVLLDSPRVRLHLLPAPRLAGRPNMPRAAFVPYAAARLLSQAVRLQRLLARLPRPDVILVQNPPAAPTLLTGLAAARMRSARMVVDWHNFGFSVLALRLGARHPLVRLARAFELAAGRRADAHLCVSRAMKAELEDSYRVGPALVLYDRPAEPFARRGDEREDRALLDRLLAERGVDAGARPAVLVSSTSWTADEDFSMLLDAAQRLDAALPAAAGGAPRMVVFVTGRGPLRERFEEEVARLAPRAVRVETLWLDADDYPRLLRAADVGLCFHRSSSGVDLPMKIADMFGAGLPVCAYDYGPCLAERLHHGENGLGFRTGEELAGHLLALFGGPAGGPDAPAADGAASSVEGSGPALAPTRRRGSALLERLREGVARGETMSWAEGWAAEARPAFGLT